MPLLDREETEHALDLACRLAADRGARIVLVAPAVLERELPLNAHLDGELTEPEGAARVGDRGRELVRGRRAAGDRPHPAGKPRRGRRARRRRASCRARRRRGAGRVAARLPACRSPARSSCSLRGRALPRDDRHRPGCRRWRDRAAHYSPAVARRRRQAQQLERVLGTNALFATAYGNVGSSIYYALGVIAVFALGLTPIVFIIAGLIFAAPPRRTPRGRCATRRPAAPPASRATPSTRTSRSRRPGRRCSTTSRRSPSRRSSCRTTSPSSGGRCARTRGTSSAASS